MLFGFDSIREYEEDRHVAAKSEASWSPLAMFRGLWKRTAFVRFRKALEMVLFEAITA